MLTMTWLATSAVYMHFDAHMIFSGGEDGPKKSQVIKSTDYGFVTDEFQQLVGFGSSLSANVDADGNSYPDLLIGSYSDTIALFRCASLLRQNRIRIARVLAGLD